MFSRFDICEAYYLFACFWHAGMGSKEYQIFTRLHRIGFEPRHGLNSEDDLEEEGRAVCDRLVAQVTP